MGAYVCVDFVLRFYYYFYYYYIYKLLSLSCFVCFLLVVLQSRLFGFVVVAKA